MLSRKRCRDILPTCKIKRKHYTVPVWHTGVTADLTDRLETENTLSNVWRRGRIKILPHLIFCSQRSTGSSFLPLLEPSQLSSSPHPYQCQLPAQKYNNSFFSFIHWITMFNSFFKYFCVLLSFQCFSHYLFSVFYWCILLYICVLYIVM